MSEDQTVSLADDPAGIPDETFLYRRVAWPAIGGRDKCSPGEQARLSGNCFRDYKEPRARALVYPRACMSVGAGRVLQTLGLEPKVMLANYPDHGLAAVTPGDIRRLVQANGDPCPQGVMLSPTEEGRWHAVVFDLGGAGERSKKAAAAICGRARWVIPLINDAASLSLD